MTNTIEWYNFVPTLFSGVIYAYLVYCGMRARMLEEFQAFYLYVLVSSVGSIANWSVLLAFGHSSHYYMYVYYGGQFAKGLCELGILYAIYRSVYRPSGLARMVPAVLWGYSTVVIALCFWQYTVVEVGKTRMLAGIPLWIQLGLLALIWIHVVLRGQLRRLGINWGGLLAGLTLMAFLETYHTALSQVFVVSRAFVPDWIQLLQLLEFVPWLVFVVAMSNRDVTWRRRPRLARRRSPADTVAADHSIPPRSRPQSHWSPAPLRRERP